MSQLKESLMLAFQYPTLPVSILLAFALLYWVVSALGLLGEDGFNSHHGHPGHHVDLSHHHHHHHHHISDSAAGTGWMDRFGFSAVPLAAFLSIMFTFIWAITYAIHANFLDGQSDAVRWGAGTVVLLVSILLALIPTALLLIPLRWLLARMSVSSSEDRDVRGCSGEVVSTMIDSTNGRVSVVSSAQGAVMVLEARSMTGAPYPRGTQIVVVSYDKTDGVCQVVSKEEFQSSSS